MERVADWDIVASQALEGKDVKDLLSAVGQGGGAAAAPAAGGAAAAGGAPAEEAKEEPKEEGEFFAVALQGVVVPRSLTNCCREGGVRRGHGFRLVRLEAQVGLGRGVRLVRLKASDWGEAWFWLLEFPLSFQHLNHQDQPRSFPDIALDAVCVPLQIWDTITILLADPDREGKAA